MSYPQTLLPQPGRKQITCDLTGRFLIRQTKVADPAELRDPQTGDVKLEHLAQPREQMTDLSTSLLGVFTMEHNKIQLVGLQKKHFSAYCAPDETIDPVPVLTEDYQISDTCGFIVIPIDKLNGFQISFNKGEETLVAECRIAHTSARWNFWHYSIRWQVGEENSFEQDPKVFKKKYWQNLLGTARSLLCMHAQTEMPPQAALERSCYEVEEAVAVAAPPEK